MQPETQDIFGRRILHHHLQRAYHHFWFGSALKQEGLIQLFLSFRELITIFGLVLL
jgi:hypothetical protein